MPGMSGWAMMAPGGHHMTTVPSWMIGDRSISVMPGGAMNGMTEGSLANRLSRATAR